MDNKELPQEITAAFEGYSIGKMYLEMGARTAQTYYNSIIEGLKADYIAKHPEIEGIAANMATNLLKAKDVEIERITELLKEQFAVKFNTPIIKLVADEQGLTPDEFFDKCWDIYKKEHNL